MLSSAFYKDLVEMERSNLVTRSKKLFTLSALHSATSALLADLGKHTVEENITIASDFWDVVAEQFTEWNLVYEGRLAASEVRQGYLHTHGVMLHAIGKCGNSLLREHENTWRGDIVKLKEINWSRNNPEWDGRSIVLGRVKKSRENITLTCNRIKQIIGIPLSINEQEVENTFINREIV